MSIFDRINHNGQAVSSPYEQQARNLLQQKGINIPANMANDPLAFARHLIQSGQAQGPYVQRIDAYLRSIGK